MDANAADANAEDANAMDATNANAVDDDAMDADAKISSTYTSTSACDSQATFCYIMLLGVNANTPSGWQLNLPSDNDTNNIINWCQCRFCSCQISGSTTLLLPEQILS